MVRNASMQKKVTWCVASLLLLTRMCPADPDQLFFKILNNRNNNTNQQKPPMITVRFEQRGGGNHPQDPFDEIAKLMDDIFKQNPFGSDKTIVNVTPGNSLNSPQIPPQQPFQNRPPQINKEPEVENKPNELVTFNDIVALDNVLKDIREIVAFLKYPDRFRAVGATMPKGILIEGPPGCGKTMIAKAIANEAGCSFFHASASSFIEMFVGVGASRIRELFKKAESSKPSIIFIDELDAIGAVNRGADHANEYRQTLNELLCQMDGFRSDGSVLVIGATNLAEELDPALKRSGRFDRILRISLPDLKARKIILRRYLDKLPHLSPAITDDYLHDVCKMIGGFSGADIKNVVNQAAILAAQTTNEEDLVVTKDHFDQAIKKVRLERSVSSINETNTIGFKDIVGLEEQLAEVSMIATYLKYPEQFSRVGAEIPHGILLSGPPGNGKTLIAKALANEAECNFMYISASEFIKKYVGTGAETIRNIFQRARNAKPTIIFIDEIDAIGAISRDSQHTNGEYRNTLNELLCQLDGFNSDPSVIVIAATNAADILDPALKRSGRFDCIIMVPEPDYQARLALAKHYCGKLPSVRYGKENDPQALSDRYFETVATQTEGLCCADLENLFKTAAKYAAMANELEVRRDHVDKSLKKLRKERGKDRSFSDMYLPTGATS